MQGKIISHPDQSGTKSCAAIIVAAGSGVRAASTSKFTARRDNPFGHDNFEPDNFGNYLPKQFWQLGDKPVIAHSFDYFHHHPAIAAIILVVAEPYIPHMARQTWKLSAIVLSAYGLTAGDGLHLLWQVMGLELHLYKADNLSFPFAVIFHIAAALNVVFSAHDKKWQEHMASLSYAGAAIAALHAGDLITLFIWWEATAITSVFLILSAGTDSAYRAAMRYLLIQVTSGVL